MYPFEKVTLRVVYGPLRREGYSMGGPWCTPLRRLLYGWFMVHPEEKVTLWVVHGVPN